MPLKPQFFFFFFKHLQKKLRELHFPKIQKSKCYGNSKAQTGESEENLIKIFPVLSQVKQ